MKHFFYIVFVFIPFISFAENDFIILQSTTSTQNSGLYEFILPKYFNFSGTKVKVVAVGTGQALKNSQNCDGDVLIVHSKQDEIKFIENEFGLYRRDLMYNDFIIIGPEKNPAKIEVTDTIEQVLKKIYYSNSIFVSRGDNSGTHKSELKLWNLSGFDKDMIKAFKYYREVGLGMGATLNVAVQLDAYTLSDRGTWLSFNNKLNHKIIFQGDKNMFNQYGIIPINPKKCKKVKITEAIKFIDWMFSDEGKTLINNFKINGEQLFFSSNN